MTMADVFGITLFLVGLALVLPAVWLLFGALWPAAVTRAQERIPAAPLKTFFTGFGVTALFTLLIVGLSAANLAAPAIIAFSLALGWSFVGTSALARHVGTRLSSAADPAWKAHLRGGVVLVLSFLVPMLGWVLVIPLALVLGVGATTLALFRRAPRPAPAPIPVREPVEPRKEEVLA